MPVLGAAVLRFAAASVYVVLRRAEVDADVLYVASLVALLSIPATALGFLVGLLQWRIYSGTALANLNTGLADADDPAELRSLLARSLEEPAVELYYAPDGRGQRRACAGSTPPVSDHPAPAAGAAQLPDRSRGGVRVASRASSATVASATTPTSSKRSAPA